MPSPKTTARERWKNFVAFIVVWVLAAIVGSALLIYFTAEPEPSPEPTEPTSIALDADVDEPDVVAAPEAESASDLPPPPAAVAKTRNESQRTPAPAPTRTRMTEAEKASKVADLIRSASIATDAGDYAAATRAYESALELDPNNFEVKILLTQVESLGDLDAREGEPQFRESPTELTGGGTLAAELMIEILPAAPNPGDPYVLRVRAHNTSDQSLALTSVELLDTNHSMKTERARASTPLAQNLGPNEVALLWERTADWSAADRTGTILVAVTLADGSRLSKSLQW